MGRTPHLTRLALGRSPFERFVDPEVFFLGEHDDVLNPQHYDESGKPRNSLSKSNREAQIRAMNEVLEVVGVTERKWKRQQEQPKPQLVFDAQSWTAMKTAEDDLGDDIFILTEFVDSVLTWWIDILRRRVQAGFVDCSVPFLSILRSEWNAFSTNSWSGKYYYLTAGLEMELLGNILAEFATDPLRYAIAWLRNKVRRAKLRPRQKRFCFQIVDFLRASGYLGIQLLFSPFTITSTLRQFRAVQDNFIPSYTRFVPLSDASPYRWGWSPGSSLLPGRTRALNTVLSPVALCLATYMATCFLHYVSYAIEHSSSSPAIVTPTKSEIDMTAIGQISHVVAAVTRPIVATRDFVLRVLGWSHSSFVQKYRNPPQPPAATNDTITTEDLMISLGASSHEIDQATQRFGDPSRTLTLDGQAAAAPPQHPSHASSPSRRSRKKRPPPTFRTTRLSTLPADLLGDRLKELGWKLALVPLEMLFHRSILIAFSQSQSGSQDGVARRLLASITETGWKGWGQIMSKVGLCFLLEAGMDVLVWFGVWSVTDWVGRRWCAWGMT
ncbi:Hypothetical protein D9617_10g073600 [Elsinoe fawcettii]|nr:Hypothetical protein D9617_10g073600 [Elsinoe fawcettii]